MECWDVDACWLDFKKSVRKACENSAVCAVGDGDIAFAGTWPSPLCLTDLANLYKSFRLPNSRSFNVRRPKDCYRIGTGAQTRKKPRQRHQWEAPTNTNFSLQSAAFWRPRWFSASFSAHAYMHVLWGDLSWILINTVTIYVPTDATGALISSSINNRPLSSLPRLTRVEAKRFSYFPCFVPVILLYICLTGDGLEGRGLKEIKKEIELVGVLNDWWCVLWLERSTDS